MDQKPKFATVYSLTQLEFETSVNAYLEQGFKILSTSSGHVNHLTTNGEYYDWFQAVLIKPEEPSKESESDKLLSARMRSFQNGLFWGFVFTSLAMLLIVTCNH